MSKNLSTLRIYESTGFINVSSLEHILHNKEDIHRNIENGVISAIVFLIKQEGNQSNLSINQKSDLYNWLNCNLILTIAISDDDCCGDLLELYMNCDIRLCGQDIKLSFPSEESKLLYDFEEKCQLLMGNEPINGSYLHMLGKQIGSEDAIKLRLINKVIDIKNATDEVKNYVDKLLKNKSSYQISAILQCFRNYKQLGLNANRELLLEQESKQFCDLVVKEYYEK